MTLLSRSDKPNLWLRAFYQLGTLQCFTAGTRRRRDMVQLLLPAAGSSTKKSIWHLQDGQNVIQPAFPCPVFQVSLGDLK